MSKIFLFDVDGTLTPAKQRIHKKFSGPFEEWCHDKDFYIISGGTFERIIEQLGRSIASKAIGIFPCMGNAYYRNVTDSTWQLMYENELTLPDKQKLFDDLDWVVKDSPFHIKTGRHYEERVGMLNFSIVGRNADMEQRKVYEEYDSKFKERQQIVSKLSPKYPELEFVIGGAVSIDIFNKGNDKSQALSKVLAKETETHEIIFVGDRIEYPGNDYSLAAAVRDCKGGKAFGVESWRDTSLLLETDLFASS